MAVAAQPRSKTTERTKRGAARDVVHHTFRSGVTKTPKAVAAPPPIEVDLVSALHPAETVTPARLETILRTKMPRHQNGGNFVFRIEKKDMESFVPQLKAATEKLESNGSLKKLGNPTWKVLTVADFDHDGFLDGLSKSLGKGGVSDEEMEEVARAWESPEAR